MIVDDTQEFGDEWLGGTESSSTELGNENNASDWADEGDTETIHTRDIAPEPDTETSQARFPTAEFVRVTGGVTQSVPTDDGLRAASAGENSRLTSGLAPRPKASIIWVIDRE